MRTGSELGTYHCCSMIFGFSENGLGACRGRRNSSSSGNAGVGASNLKEILNLDKVCNRYWRLWLSINSNNKPTV